MIYETMPNYTRIRTELQAEFCCVSDYSYLESLTSTLTHTTERTIRKSMEFSFFGFSRFSYVSHTQILWKSDKICEALTGSIDIETFSPYNSPNRTYAN